MILFGVEQESGRDSLALKGGEGGQTVSQINTVVLASMDDKHRRAPLIGQASRVENAVTRRIGPGRSFEFPLREPKFLSSTVRNRYVVESVVHYEGREARRSVSLEPVDHKSTVRGSASGQTVAIDPWVLVQYDIESVHEIVEGDTSPVSAHHVAVALSESGRSVGVDHGHSVAALSPKLRIPSIAPSGVPSALWTAVDEQYKGPLFGGVESSGLEEPALNGRAVRSGRTEVELRGVLEIERLREGWVQRSHFLVGTWNHFSGARIERERADIGGRIVRRVSIEHSGPFYLQTSVGAVHQDWVHRVSESKIERVYALISILVKSSNNRLSIGSPSVICDRAVNMRRQWRRSPLSYLEKFNM